MPRPFLPCTTVAALLALAAASSAQTLDDFRRSLSEGLRQAQFASSFGGLIFLSDELELSGARYRIDGGSGSDTTISTIAFPFRNTFRPWGEEATGLYVEGTLGYAQASIRTGDLYEGALPGLETAVNSELTTYGGLLGLGAQFEIGEGLSFTPILNGGLARIDSHADYDGPGASVSSALLDGIAFNWDGWTRSLGTAARIDWLQPLGEEHELELVGRYDLRWTETFDTDDVAQEFSSRLQLVTLRADVVGPTGFSAFGHPVGWRGMVGYRNFAEGDLFGVRHLVLLGGALELEAEELPLGRTVSLSGAVIVGDDVKGFTLGVGVAF